jgi:hypothetical protein
LLCQAIFPPLKWFKIATMVLYQGYNEALPMLIIYALVNSDIEVTANWLQMVLTFEKSHKQLIQPKLLDFKKTYTLNMLCSGGSIDKIYPSPSGRV